MSASRWLKSLAVVLALFAAGHTLGTAAPRATRGAHESALFLAMQTFRFPVMGFERSYWDFYRGFAITISVLLIVMSVLAWQLSAIARRDPAQALPMAVVLQLGCAGILAASATFFFAAPIILASAGVLCATAAIVSLVREARGHSQPLPTGSDLRAPGGSA